MRALVTGGTGFVGGRLAERLVAGGASVRALVRDRSRSKHLGPLGARAARGRRARRRSRCAGAGEGIDVAYYLIHSMGRGGEGEFAERERRAARELRRDGAREGVGRVVYLGGLGDATRPSTCAAATRPREILAEHGPPLTYFRAGMVVGARQRVLPDAAPPGAAAAGDDRPRLAATPTQPIAIDDVIAYLAARARGRGVERARGPDRRPGRPLLRRDARRDGRRARQAPPRRASRCRCSRRGCPRCGSAWSRRSTPASRGRWSRACAHRRS